jgi:hypothetical protein
MTKPSPVQTEGVKEFKTMHSKVRTRKRKYREELIRKKKKKINEENSRLKNLTQGLLEQIKTLKEEKLENIDNRDIDKSNNKENSPLKNHNRKLLMQIKKLKND